MLDRLTVERLEHVAACGPIVVAFSGGGDSAALLLLLAAHFGVERVRAVVVDHAMRAGSAVDAKQALDFAESHAIRAEVLTLSWADHKPRSQQAAREARHRALCAAARRLDARVIALGHTADDQAETVILWELEQAGFDVAALGRLAQRMRAIADQVDLGAAELIARAATFQDDAISVELGAWSGHAAVRERALAVLICAASGERRAAPSDAIARLEARMLTPEFCGATLGGTALSLRRGRVVISRDSGALSGRAGGSEPLAPALLPVGEELVWDGRLALTASAPGVMVCAGGPKPRIEAPDKAIVATHWLLVERVAHMLAAPKLGVQLQDAANRLNIPKP
ncbi:MAG: hypothetical protein HY054_11070 [Proteobacteria bacterium]|nr:hypothetical protein [Pseudomonadota bacterium]